MTIAKYIDHTLLKPEATREQIVTLCQEAKEYCFKSVCVNPCWVAEARKQLENSEVLVCTVIGFPLGANSSAVKAFETQQAIQEGAKEVDMVINIGLVKSGEWDLVAEDIHSVVKAAEDKALVKVIIETCLLMREEIIKVSEIIKASGAAFVKTSTGFSTAGAKVEDIALIRQTVGPNFDIKASGGVANYQEAMAMIKHGATRIGASKGIQIVKEAQLAQNNL